MVSLLSTAIRHFRPCPTWIPTFPDVTWLSEFKMTPTINRKRKKRFSTVRDGAAIQISRPTTIFPTMPQSGSMLSVKSKSGVVTNVGHVSGIALQSTTVQKLFPIPVWSRQSWIGSQQRRATSISSYIQVGRVWKWVAVEIMSVMLLETEVTSTSRKISDFFQWGCLWFSRSFQWTGKSCVHAQMLLTTDWRWRPPCRKWK